MPEIKTVSVISKNPNYHNGEPFTINEEDFDAQIHVLAEAEPVTEPGAEGAPDAKPTAKKAK